MKQRIFLTIATLLISSSVDGVVRPVSPNDAVMHGYMIGVWVVDPRDPDYEKYGGAISTYNSDGTVEFSQFKDVACTELFFRSHAVWEIRNSFLVITVVSSDRPDLHPRGLVVMDRVLDIDKKSLILENKRGKIQYRLHRDSCVSPKHDSISQ
jgi:hypothetical protein